MSEKESWTVGRIKDFILDKLCKNEEGVNFKPLLDDEEIETPDPEDFITVTEALKSRNLVFVDRPTFEEFFMQLTSAGERFCKKDNSERAHAFDDY